MNETSITNAPTAPAGIDPKVWEAALAAAKAAVKPASTRKTTAGLVELTPETAQKLYDEGKWEVMTKAGDLGLLVILPTIETTAEGGCYSLAVVKDGKVTAVEPAHIDRVRSNRCLPRAIRLLGTYLGENGGKQFSNGSKGKQEAAPTPAPVIEAPKPEPVAEATAPTGKKSGKTAAKKSNRK